MSNICKVFEVYKTIGSAGMKEFLKTNIPLIEEDIVWENYDHRADSIVEVKSHVRRNWRIIYRRGECSRTFEFRFSPLNLRSKEVQKTTIGPYHEQRKREGLTVERTTDAKLQISSFKFIEKIPRKGVIEIEFCFDDGWKKLTVKSKTTSKEGKKGRCQEFFSKA